MSHSQSSIPTLQPDDGEALSTVAAVRTVTPEELACWLEERADAIAERWFLELRATGIREERPYDGLVRAFLRLLVDFLPPGMTGYREQVEPIFQQAAEVYGNLGAIRGLAAGEAVEEFQLLREVLFRFLHDAPPGEGERELGIRELLQLNRFVDTGVTYASIGHTDSLFFNLFHGGGVTEEPTEQVESEIREQIALLARDLAEVMEVRSPRPSGRPA